MWPSTTALPAPATAGNFDNIQLGFGHRLSYRWSYLTNTRMTNADYTITIADDRNDPEFGAPA
jgi:hypothetical protein